MIAIYLIIIIIIINFLFYHDITQSIPNFYYLPTLVFKRTWYNEFHSCYIALFNKRIYLIKPKKNK